MKVDQSFTAERTFARHCPELLREGLAPDELMKLLGRMGERLARLLGAALVPLLGGSRHSVRYAAPVSIDAETLIARTAPLAASSLFTVGAQDVPVVASINGAAVLGLVDRTFGGSGKLVEDAPISFPLSADLLILRLERLIAAQLAQALGVEDRDHVRPLRRDGSVSGVVPYAEDTPLALLMLTVEEAGCDPWDIALAVPVAALVELLSDAGSRAVKRAVAPRSADPLAEPFADVALPMTAVLVDMQLPFATISTLEPGIVLPVAVARQVPLQIGGRTVAQGTIGALDDRVAIQITRTF